MDSRHRQTASRGLWLLAVTALAVLGIGASAQASEWEVGSQSMVGRDLSTAPVNGSGGTTTITGKVLGSAVQLSCSSTTSKGSLGTGGTGSATIELAGCSFSKPSNCDPPVLLLEANTSLIQVGGSTYQKFVPKNGTSFATLEFKGQECGLNGVAVPLKGAFVLAGPLSESTASKTLSYSSAINSEAGVTLNLGSNSAAMSGSITNVLTYPLNGEAWRALPGVSGVANWKVEGGSLPAAAYISGGSGTLSFSVGGGVTVNCSGVSSEGAEIVSGGIEKLKSMTFSGCTVAKPSGCSVPNGKISTNPLSGSLSMIEGEAYEKFVPQTAGGPLFELQLSGGSCSLSGSSWTVSGSFGGIGKGYGVTAYSQPLEFSATSNAKTGSGFTIGSSTGKLTGSMSQSLSIPYPWGVQ